MYIIINETKYTELKSLSFAPEIDVSGGSVPATEFQADIVTSDAIPYGELAYLYDDLDDLWAMYRIVYAERVELESVRVRAQSRVAMLERMMLPEVMYEQATGVEDILRETFTTMYGGYYYNIGEYTVDPAFDNVTLTGYFPEQKARERLQWVLYAIGGYVKDFFGEVLEVRAIPSTGETLVPEGRTFYKPKLTFRDYVTGVKAVTTEYTPTPEKPEDRDQKYIEVGEGNYYLVTNQEIQINNPDVPENAPPNVAELKENGIVGPGNVSGLLRRMGDYLYRRMEVDLDCVNNGTYMPGQYLAAYVDPERIVAGVATRCDFKFGVQARASVKLTSAVELPCAKLTMKYISGGTQLGKRALYLPIGHGYDLQALWIERTEDGERTIFRPLSPRITGTMPQSNTAVEVPCEPYPRAKIKITENGEYLPEEGSCFEPVVVKVKKTGTSVSGVDGSGNPVSAYLDPDGYIRWN